jgi:hypothetical protein
MAINAWAIRMLAAAEKLLIQLNRKTTEFYRTAVVRANEADLPPAGVQAGLRGLWRTVFARRRQYLKKPITRIRRMTHKYVEGQVRFSYDNQ